MGLIGGTPDYVPVEAFQKYDKAHYAHYAQLGSS